MNVQKAKDNILCWDLCKHTKPIFKKILIWKFRDSEQKGWKVYGVRV